MCQSCVTPKRKYYDYSEFIVKEEVVGEGIQYVWDIPRHEEAIENEKPSNKE
jgi:hypothetical protein